MNLRNEGQEVPGQWEMTGQLSTVETAPWFCRFFLKLSDGHCMQTRKHCPAPNTAAGIPWRIRNNGACAHIGLEQWLFSRARTSRFAGPLSENTEASHLRCVGSLALNSAAPWCSLLKLYRVHKHRSRKQREGETKRVGDLILSSTDLLYNRNNTSEIFQKFLTRNKVKPTTGIELITTKYTRKLKCIVNN